MVRNRTRADDADMQATHHHRTYHPQLRILMGLIASTVVVLLAQLPR
jgi:hypothetical protein